MKKLFLGLAFLLVGGMSPALAGESDVLPATGAWVGAVLDPATTSPTTTDILDFGFQADVVRLCMQASSVPIRIRFGRVILAESSTANFDSRAEAKINIPAATDANFTDGLTDAFGQASLAALAMDVGGNNNDSRCVVYETNKALGVAIYIASGLATVDVQAFQR